MIGRGLMRGPISDDIRRWAFLFVILLLIVVGAAVVRNFIEERRHPELRSKSIDSARDFQRANARGMVDILMKKKEK